MRHCATGLGIWDWAGNDEGQTPDVVMACAGDVPTLETMAAVDLLRQEVPALKVRVVNVADLMALQAPSAHPPGLPDADFDAIFTTDRPVIFAFHGYPALVHQLIYKRRNHPGFHVHGYCEEGTTTTPFDMTMLNRLDRFHLAANAITRVPHLCDRLLEHRAHITRHGRDMPQIENWRWTR